MKSYYHAHESAYQQIKAKGFVGWGNAKSLQELGDAKTFEYLKNAVERFFPDPGGKEALDIGCGTGTTAFALAKAGFNVTGVDISETAIEIGRDLAEKQQLSIDFKIADVLRLEDLEQKFDLIYDSHCLHCIVFDIDRARVLEGIKNSLGPSGIFILDTMVMPQMKTNPEELFEGLRLDDEFILWHKTKPSDVRGVIEIDGQFWCAQRRVYPADVVKNEAIMADFEIIESVVESQPGKPSMLRMVLK